MSVLTGVLFIGFSVLLSLLWCNLIAVGHHLTRRARTRPLVRPDQVPSDVLA